MGLDGVELILAVEDVFQIHISDEEVSSVSTVGELHSLVIAKLQGLDTKTCLTSAAFYRTRRGIVDALGLGRRGITPSTPLRSLLPRKRRRENWRRIQEAMNLKLPELEHPGWIVVSLLAAGIGLTMIPTFYGQSGFAWVPLLMILGLVVGGLLIKFSPYLTFAFPNRNITVGDLS